MFGVTRGQHDQGGLDRQLCENLVVATQDDLVFGVAVWIPLRPEQRVKPHPPVPSASKFVGHLRTSRPPLVPKFGQRVSIDAGVPHRSASSIHSTVAINPSRCGANAASSNAASRACSTNRAHAASQSNRASSLSCSCQ